MFERKDLKYFERKDQKYLRERINAPYRIQADNARGYPLIVPARMPRADTHLSYLRRCHVRIPLLYLRGLPLSDTHLLYLRGLPRADRGEFLREYFYKFKGIKTPNYYKAYFL